MTDKPSRSPKIIEHQKLKRGFFDRILAIQLVSIFFLSSFITETTAQDSEFLFRQINTSNGLSNDYITCMLQDSYGYIWIGTDEGLNRYNGYENKQFKRILFDSTSIIDNHIVSLFIDSKKRLWVGTLNGLCLYDDKHENFTHFIPEKEQAFVNTLNRITGIREDSKNDIYITSEIGVLYVLKGGRLIPVKEFNSFGNIKDFIIDQSGIFWIGTLKGIIKFNLETDEIITVSNYSNKGNLKDFTFTQTILDYGGKIWIGTNSGQVGFINKDDNKSGILEFTDIPYSSVNDIHICDNGSFQIATSEGLFLLDENKKLLSHYYYQQNNSNGISSSSVNCIYKDIQNNLWYGTVQGLNLVMNGKAFKNYNAFSPKVQLDVRSIQSLTLDSKGNYWLGSYYRGLNVINLASGQKKFYMPDSKDPNALGESSVLSIFEDSRKNIWIGSYSGHLQRYHAPTDNFISYKFNNLSNGSKEVTDIRSMIEDKDGNLWFLSHGFGLFKFNPVTNKFKYFTRDHNNIHHSLADNWAYQAVIDQDSILWIATPSGLSKFNIYTEVFNNYYYHPSDSTSLSNNHVNAVFCDSQENIWIGTFFGLNLFNKNEGIFYHFYENDGLPSNQIKSFLEEKPGTIWMGTGHGLSKMEFVYNHVKGKPIVNFRNYNKADNLQDLFFWERSAVKTPSGELAFGTESGIIVFNPKEITDNTTPPNIYITELSLFNKKVNIGDHDSLLSTHLSFTKEIRLKHDQNFISFKFVAINHISPENNQYSYILENFDENWIKVGNKREAIYTNLTPGKYRFIVKASNNDGIWNETGVWIDVTVLPPWWKTIWFQIILYLTIIGLLWLLYFLRTTFLRKQQKKLIILVRERTMQLEETAASLEEKQEEINSQHEELLAQRDELGRANQELIAHQEKILDQHDELEKHRLHLEILVEERTTALILAKEKAEESDRLKSSFLANLSHEIRTPLNAMLGFSALLGETDITDEERNQFISIIQNSSNTLLELINDILDISRIEAGQMELVMKPIYLGSVIGNLVNTFDVLLKQQEIGTEKNLSLKVNIIKEISDWKIVTDKLRLEQILSNLISNALKFTTHGYIEIGCIKQPDNKKYLQFYVKDTGIGMNEENLKIIFDRFRKIEDDKNQLYRGTGLGLSISMQLVQMLGGNMWVTSKIGEGSTFYFTIPENPPI